jgi:demethylmenaquinone methyltransferase/2-methoxy-6-polyprenyl-1,4-benzoquinol methylase
LALAYFRRAGGRTPIVAADFCPEMLVIGRRKGDRAGANGQMMFVEADAQRLPFPDDSFQIVAVAFGLRNVANTDRGLCEMTRVCRPGGRVVVLEFSLPRSRALRGLYNWYFRNVLPRIGQAVSGSRSSAYDYLPASVGEFPSGEALAERMWAAGLNDVTYTPLTFGVATLYVGVK